MTAPLSCPIDKELRVSHLCDAMDDLGLPSNAGGSYHHLGGRETVFGRAFTLRQERLSNPSADRSARHGEAAGGLVPPGHILVIDAGDITDVVTWGEAHTLRAISNRLAGVVVHGAIRDVSGIAARGFPVLYRGIAPLRSAGRLTTADIGKPVELDGVRIAPGDLVAFDSDGLVAVSPHIEGQVLETATAIMQRDKIRDHELEELVRSPK
jgi:regulator of RNase E activity RraA